MIFIRCAACVRHKYILFILTLIMFPFGRASLAEDYKQNALCVDGSPKLCPTMPADLTGLGVRFGYNPSTNPSRPSNDVTQINFDYFAWQMFVALNWPADTNGNPSTTSNIANDQSSPRVWEAYHTIADVYPGNSIPNDCAIGDARLLLSNISKVTSDSFIEPFSPWPLIDAAGNFVVYDIRLNDREKTYIKGDNAKGLDLSTKEGQTKFLEQGGVWDFPRGLGSEPGAVELKTSWRIFPPGADTSGFFTLTGVVQVGADNSATGEKFCLSNVTLGLVGMHMMQKITTPKKFSDYWVWATFEHQANAPNAQTVTPSPVNGHSTAHGIAPLAACPAPTHPQGDWSFFNTSCTTGGQACTPNTPPSSKDQQFLWQKNPPYAKSYLMDNQYGTQVTRCWAIYQTAQIVTNEFQTALKALNPSTPWANYQLVGAQWAMAASEGAPSIEPFSAPFYSTNTTLETYFQISEIGLPNNPGQTPGSCIACHLKAKDAVGNESNFSFLTRHAK